MADEKIITGKITKIGEVRQNSTGTGYNFFLMIEGLGNGVYFFGSEDELNALADRIDTEHMFKLDYTEDPKGIKGKNIEVATQEEQDTLDSEKEETPTDPVARVIYCRWNNTNKELTKEQMEDYNATFIAYAIGLYKDINTIAQDEHMCEQIFDKMCQPFQYYIEDRLRVDDANKG